MFFNRNKEKVPVNPYYMGDGCFNFPGLYESFSLRIMGAIELSGYSNLYLCNLCYSCNDSSSDDYGKNLYYRLVVGFDMDHMIYDSKYTRFVFDRVINRKNLMKISDFSYDFIDRSIGINYIGSVLNLNDNYVFYDDDNIRNVVNFSSVRGHSKKKSEIDERRERAFMSSINRQAKVLRMEMDRMTIYGSDYQKNK